MAFSSQMLLLSQGMPSFFAAASTSTHPTSPPAIQLFTGPVNVSTQCEPPILQLAPSKIAASRTKSMGSAASSNPSTTHSPQQASKPSVPSGSPFPRGSQPCNPFATQHANHSGSILATHLHQQVVGLQEQLASVRQQLLGQKLRNGLHQYP